MLADGALDLPRLKSLIDWHIAEGTDGIVIVGTTGESPTVDVAEHCRLIESAVEFAAGRVPVIAGTGGNSTREAIELTKFAKQGRRELFPFGGAVLQQADAGRAVPPFQGDRGIRRHPGDPLQRAVAHGGRPGQRHGDAPRAGAEHRRHQGSDLERRARDRPHEARAQGLPRLQRRRRHGALVHAARRARRDLGHRQRRPAPHARDVRRRAPARPRRRSPSTIACSACTRTCSSNPIPSR